MATSMTKKDIIRAVRNDKRCSGMTYEKLNLVITAALEAATTALTEGTPIVLNDIGKFTVKTNQPRKSTFGGSTTGTPTRTVKFTTAKAFKERLTAGIQTGDDEPQA